MTFGGDVNFVRVEFHRELIVHLVIQILGEESCSQRAYSKDHTHEINNPSGGQVEFSRDLFGQRHGSYLNPSAYDTRTARAVAAMISEVMPGTFRMAVGEPVAMASSKPGSSL